MARPWSAGQARNSIPTAADTRSPYGHWHTGICACCDPCDIGLCCDGFWCWPCDTSRVYNVVRHERPWAIHMPVCLTLTFADVCIHTCTAIIEYATGTPTFILAEALTCLFYSGFSSWFRITFTEKYQIREDPCAACCMAFWCPACSTCQMMVQLRDTSTPTGGQCCWQSSPYAPQVRVAAGHSIPHRMAQPRMQPGYPAGSHTVVGVPLQAHPIQGEPQGKCAA
eukprot:TRINITY_DN13645_c0_g1_i2.p1 TRINITY_DN13645_c0_g1~~TRINITY_DN13645_c0_g1_i2.p1  ORF type:complete len:225 (+),score=3.59 TRINITY_DN13645_c0_g1_i2:99-773(+)